MMSTKGVMAGWGGGAQQQWVHEGLTTEGQGSPRCKLPLVCTLSLPGTSLRVPLWVSRRLRRHYVGKLLM